MKRARKWNRVSWAPGFNLCQVKLFSSEDCPSKVSQTSQDLLQAKTSSTLHSSTNESYDLPPGFEGNHFSNHLRNELSHFYQIKWKAPPLFALSQNWLVAAGEESREKVDQKQREMKVLEAVYPRSSAIPPSPSVSLDVEEEDYDDNLTPFIPIVPIEEEELMDVSQESLATIDTSATLEIQSLQQSISAKDRPICSQPSTSSALASPGTSGLEADLAAASAVVAAIMSNEQGSSIDMDLLVRILNDPLLIEKLIGVRDGAAATTVSTSANIVGFPSSGFKSAFPPVSSSSRIPDKPTFGVNPPSIVGLFPDSGLMPATSSVQLMHTLDKPATPLLPFSRPMPGQLASPSAPLPSHTATAGIHKPVKQTTDHLSGGGLTSVSTLRPQQDTVKQAAPVAFISSREPSVVPLPSTGMGMPAVVNQVRPSTTTMAHRPSTSSAFIGKEAHPVKDLSYYKNLIRQHGADDNDNRLETHDSQIDIRQTNTKDLKPVHNNKPGEVNLKTQKPCIYFKSSRGCRNGSNCPYQHDMSAQWGSLNVLGPGNAKRAELGPDFRSRALI